MKQEFIAACQAFLIPTSILFVALALSTNQAMKTMISLVAWLINVVWLSRLLPASDLPARDHHAAVGLAVVFTGAWLILAALHAYWWYQEAEFPWGRADNARSDVTGASHTPGT